MGDMNVERPKGLNQKHDAPTFKSLDSKGGSGVEQNAWPKEGSLARKVQGYKATRGHVSPSTPNPIQPLGYSNSEFGVNQLPNTSPKSRASNNNVVVDKKVHKSSSMIFGS